MVTGWQKCFVTENLLNPMHYYSLEINRCYFHSCPHMYMYILYIYIYVYAHTHTHTHKDESKSNDFLFCTGIITYTGTCIIHQNEAGPL